MNDPLAQLDAIDACWCWACAAVLDKQRTFYRLCPECGNKRCPKATNHQHHCSGSNDAGQCGSAYGTTCLQLCCDEYRDYIERRTSGYQ